jgi:hypothetical protein
VTRRLALRCRNRSAIDGSPVIEDRVSRQTAFGVALKRVRRVARNCAGHVVLRCAMAPESPKAVPCARSTGKFNANTRRT